MWNSRENTGDKMMVPTETIRSSGSPFTVIDGHVDVLYEMTSLHEDTPFDQISRSSVTLDKMRAGNVNILVTALYCPDTFNGEQSAASYLRRLIAYASKFMTGLAHIRSDSELEDCIRQDSPGMILLVENADGFLEIDRAILSETGIRVAGLTHMGRNRIADGNNVRFPGGLSSAGTKLVRELSAEGFAFDAAHLAERGFRELVRIHDGPLISSHTGIRPLCDIPRNLTPEQIGIILERKGIVGITADPRMLSMDGKAAIEDVFRNIDWIAQRFETDGIAIGSDFCGFPSLNQGLEDISKLADLSALFLRAGYPHESVEGIMGMNWYRFYRKLLANGF